MYVSSCVVSSTVLAISIVLAFLVLCSCAFIGVTVCVVAIVVYHKKKTLRARTVNVTENSSDNYWMSEPAPRYTPRPAPTAWPQESNHAQNQCNTETVTVREEDHNIVEDGDENKPLMT